MQPVAPSLLPATADVLGDLLSVGGVPIDELAATFGTPLIVYDEQDIRDRCRAAVDVFGAGNVTYAGKAFLCRALARLVADEGLDLDVTTAGELGGVLDAGVPAERVVVHGNNKATHELAEAMRLGVRDLVVDNLDELDRIETLHADGSPPVRVRLRISPGHGVGGHSAIRTGQFDSKFGLPLLDGIAAQAVRRVRESPATIWDGVHAHAGSQVLDVEQLAGFVQACAAFALEVDAPALTLGGGLGIAYTGDEVAPTFAAWHATLAANAGAAGWTQPFGVEPGRALVGPTAMNVYRVGTVKDIPGVRRYVAVDGGMSDHPRPAMYGARYEAFLVRDPRARRDHACRIVGKHCESGDVVVDEAWLPADVAVGDLVAVPATGAYGYSMASTYNRVPRPAVVFVRGGAARPVLRRETLDDLSRLEVDDQLTAGEVA